MRAALKIAHRWLGLVLVVPLLVQGVTGAILALEPPFHPDTSVVAQTVSADAIVAAVSGPTADDLHAVRYVPPTANAPAEVWLAPSASPRGRGIIVVRVDPFTLHPIWPPEPREGPLEWARRLHHDFMLSDYGGRTIVGWVGIGLVLMSVMGIPIWWPAKGQWRTAFTFSAQARGFRFHRRLHGTVGIWTVVLMLISASTGAVLGFPRTVRTTLGIQSDGPPRASSLGASSLGASSLGASSPGASSRANSVSPAMRLDAALTLATDAAPGMVPRVLFLPASTGGPMRVVLAPPGAEGAASMATVTVDPAGTRVLGVQDTRKMTGAALALRQMRDLHFGLGFGIVWRCLTIAGGLALPVFAVTGVAMWLSRRRTSDRTAATCRAALSAGE